MVCTPEESVVEFLVEPDSLYLAVVFSVYAGCTVAISTVSLLGYGMAVGWPGQRLLIPEDELKVKEALCRTTICYPNAMGLGKQTFWLFLCVRVKFMFPTVAFCPSLRLHTKVCKSAM